MFYYINQLDIQSFPIGLVKMVLMLILFWLSQTWPVTLRIWEKVFSSCTMPPDSKETELGRSDQGASPSAAKNTRVVLVPSLHMKVHPFSYYQWCGYLWGVISFDMNSQWWGSQKLLQGLVPHKLTAYFSIFNLFKLNELWSYYQKHVNQIILNCATPAIAQSLALRIFEAFIQIL